MHYVCVISDYIFDREYFIFRKSVFIVVRACYSCIIIDIETRCKLLDIN